METAPNLNLFDLTGANCQAASCAVMSIVSCWTAAELRDNTDRMTDDHILWPSVYTDLPHDKYFK